MFNSYNSTIKLISTIAPLFVIFSFIRIKGFRKQPGDLLTMMAVIEFLMKILRISFKEEFWQKYNENKDDQTQCYIFLSLDNILWNFQLIYTYAFCFYIIIKIKREWPRRICNLHKITFFSALLYTFICYYFKLPFLSFEDCQDVDERVIYSQKKFYQKLIQFLINILLNLYSIYLIKSEIPQIPQIKKKRKRVLKYYSAFLIFPLFDAMAIMLQFWQEKEIIEFHWIQLLFLKKSFIISIFIISNKEWRNIVFCLQQENEQSILPTKKSFTQLSLFDEIIREKMNSQIYTILAGLEHHIKNVLYKTGTLKEFTKEQYKEQIKLPINQEKYEMYDKCELHCLNSSITIYAPQVFKSLIDNEKHRIDFLQSIDLQKNMRQIHLIGSKAGKNRDFYLDCNDNMLILKSITQAELETFMKMLKPYYNYLKKNPNSLITKVFGIFTIDYKENIGQQSFILMENICKIPQQYIMKIFDLNGAKLDRQVIKDGKISLSDQFYTLMDIDFINFEAIINIKSELKRPLMLQIKKDAKFFEDLGIIDYSMILFKVDRSNEGINQSLIEKFGKDSPEDNLKQIKCIDDSVTLRNTYWHIGIIDYFSHYKINKKASNKIRKEIKINPDFKLLQYIKLPVVYSNRFIQFFQNVLDQKYLSRRGTFLDESAFASQDPTFK